MVYKNLYQPYMIFFLKTIVSPEYKPIYLLW